MSAARTRVGAACVASALIFALVGAAPAGATRAQQAWGVKADKVCRRADTRMFARLDRHHSPSVTTGVSDLTRKERLDLVAVIGIVGDTATATANDLGAVRAGSPERADVKAVIKALRHSAKTQQAAAAKVRRAHVDPLLLVADTASPDEIAALGIDRAGQVGAHECGVLLGDLLWSRDPALLVGSSPAELAALVSSEPPLDFTTIAGDPTGAIDIAKLGADYAGSDETAAEGTVELENLGFSAGYELAFERPDSFEWASIEMLEFSDPAGAAAYLDNVRWATEDAVEDVYAVPDIPNAWGYSETYPSGETARYVVFRAGSFAFYVQMTGVPGYTEGDVLALAQSQIAYLEGGSASASNTPEDAIGAGVEAAGERYVGDCSAADPSTDVGAYCSLLLEDHGSSRLYGVGPVASEITDRVTVTIQDQLWVVVD